jgi:N-acetylglucosaminyldiphosphoundecaprenol N-acetyl-beta-D-mannosaminyltransferase
MANETTVRLATDSQEAAIPTETDAVASQDVVHPKKHPMGHSFPSVQLRGMEIHSVSLQQAVDHLIQCSLRGVGGWIVTPNLDILRRHVRSISFRNLVATSTLNVADGMPLVWISRLLGQPLPERVNGTDLMVDVCEASAKAGRSVFFLGGNHGVAEKTGKALTEAFPGLNVAGCHCPEYGFENNVENITFIANILSETKPDIVFVGLGSPKQDVLINMLRLKFPSVWWLGVGVSFSFIAGELSRAPDWAKKYGLEWLYRLIAEPERLAKRYLVQGIPFFAATVLVAVYSRIFNRKS